MKIDSVAVTIAKREGHRSHARIGDIREILGILSDMSYENGEVIQAIIKNGIARAKRRKPRVLRRTK